jgi:hypothetical protein
MDFITSFINHHQCLKWLWDILQLPEDVPPPVAIFANRQSWK